MSGQPRPPVGRRAGGPQTPGPKPYWLAPEFATPEDYQIEGEIARGGMGVVYRARQRSLDRKVALKFILTGPFATADEVRRFHREAALAARLDHPNIVPIYDIGDIDGRPFFSMKLVDGPSLATPGALPASAEVATPGPTGRAAQREVARFVATIARAVHHAHQRALLHRDLKPANILIDRDGIPYVTDFGLALLMDARATQARTTVLFGTPAYMAPEQAANPQAATLGVDVYALGAILYELLTNRPPFVAPTPMETLVLARETEPKRPELLTPTLDPDLSTICLKCLRKAPEDRYPSILALAEDLDRFADGRAIRARRASLAEKAWREARRRPAIAGLLLLLAAAITAVVVGSVAFAARLKDANEIARRRLWDASLAQAKNERLSGRMFRTEGGSNALREAAAIRVNSAIVNETLAQLGQFDFRLVSPRETLPGGNLAFADGLDLVASSSGDTVELRRRSKASPPWHWRCPDHRKIEGLILSRDGRRCMAVDEEETAWILDAAGFKLLAEFPRAPLGRFSPDGRRLLIGNYSRKFRLIDAESGREIQTGPWPTFGPDDYVLCPDDRPYAAIVTGRSVAIWDWKAGRFDKTIGSSVPPRSLDWEGGRLAVGDESGGVTLYDVDRPGSAPIQLVGHRSPVDRLWLRACLKNRGDIISRKTTGMLDKSILKDR